MQVFTSLNNLSHNCNYVLQIIPAENIVAAFQGSQKTVLAISKTHSEAQIFLEVSAEYSLIRGENEIYMPDLLFKLLFSGCFLNCIGVTLNVCAVIVGLGAWFGWSCSKS